MNSMTLFSFAYLSCLFQKNFSFCLLILFTFINLYFKSFLLIFVARRVSSGHDSTLPTPIPTISEVSDIYSMSPRSPLMEVLNLRDIRYQPPGYQVSTSRISGINLRDIRWVEVTNFRDIRRVEDNAKEPVCKLFNPVKESTARDFRLIFFHDSFPSGILQTG